MKIAPKPINEKKRLEALISLEILDSVQEEAYDMITELASSICETPISLISLVDKDRQWFKSSKGLSAKETSRDIAFCSHAILSEDIFTVSNANEDERFSDNPLVTSGPNISFYAGVPLKNSNGFKVGTLCVIDQQAKSLTKEQERALIILAKQVETQLAYRAKAIELRKVQMRKDMLMGHIVHDLKNPLTILNLKIRTLKKKIDQSSPTGEILKGCTKMTTRMNGLINNILDIAKLEDGKFKVNKKPTNLSDLLNSVATDMKSVIGDNKSIKCETEINGPLMIDESIFRRVIENLISNAIKYSCTDDQIIVKCYSIGEKTMIEVIDHGPGIPDNMKKDVFSSFSMADHKNTSEIESHGLGLNFCSLAIEGHGGKIWVEDNKPKGSIFKISLTAQATELKKATNG